MDLTEQAIEAVRNSFFALIIGVLLSVIQVLPQTWLTQEQKTLVVLGLGVLFVGGVGLSVFYGQLREYRRLGRKVDTYLNVIPKLVTIHEHDRTIRIKENGDSVVSNYIRIENKSDRDIPNLYLPSTSDLSEPPDFDGDFPSSESAVEITEVRIQGRDVANPEGCYELEGIQRHPDNDPVERGFIKIPLHEVGGLDPNDPDAENPVDIRFEYTVSGSLIEAIEGQRDYIDIDTYHPTTEASVRIYPPTGYRIELKTDDHSHGIFAKDKHARLEDSSETSSVDKPQVKRAGEAIDWGIPQPNLNYSYRIHFNCIAE